MMDANKNLCPIRVVMFPWLGYGHITPYLELAKKLSSRGFITYLCSTKATLNCIDKNITEKLSQSIKLVPLHLPTTLPGFPYLPPDFHTTNGLPPHLMPALKAAFESSVDDFSKILINLKPDLLIYDSLQPWAPAVAKEQRIPAVQFITSSSTMTSFMFHYFKKPSAVFPFSKIYFRRYEVDNMKKLLDCANPADRERQSEGVQRSCKIVLIKGFRDIEGKYIDYVTSLVGRKFVPVGPLVQEPCLDDDKDDGSSDIFHWLDKKDRKSTVFVSFGSEYFLEKHDMYDIAYGLELSRVNFIWVVRFPKGENGCNGMLEKALPRGFLERVGNRGKVVEGWAPQTKILGHANIGGFVSHCGWNSVMESMKFGVPIIAVPMHLDQPINARLVEEVGVGVEVVRDDYKRLHKERLAAVINQVVMEGCGESVRQKAADMKEKLRSKGDQEIDDVVQELVGLCNTNSTEN